MTISLSTLFVFVSKKRETSNYTNCFALQIFVYYQSVMHTTKHGPKFTNDRVSYIEKIRIICILLKTEICLCELITANTNFSKHLCMIENFVPIMKHFICQISAHKALIVSDGIFPLDFTPAR